MEKIIYDTDKQINFPSYLNNDESFCFLDIETDGLNSYSNNIILIGIYIFKKNEQKLIQLFAEKKSYEREILKDTLKYLKDVDTIFTYNGNTFDIPFIKTKLKKYGLSFDFDILNNIDLLSLVRKHKNILNLENCKLKTVEKTLGIEREDTISGEESIILYKQYVETLNPAYKKTILKHNYDDIYYLPNILSIESMLDQPSILNTTLQNKHMKFSIDFKKTKLKNNTLTLTGNIFQKPKRDFIVYEDIYNLFLEKNSNIYKLILYSTNHKNIEFIDLEDINFNISIKHEVNKSEKLENILIIANNNNLNMGNISIFLEYLFKNL